MDGQPPAPGNGQHPQPPLALVVRRPLGVPARRERPAGLAALPALVAERLPALWNGGRGPLAQAMLAGGLLALGSVLSRRAGVAPGALVAATRSPRGRDVAPPAAPARPARVAVETELTEGAARGANGATVRWRSRRVTVIEELAPTE